MEGPTGDTSPPELEPPTASSSLPDPCFDSGSVNTISFNSPLDPSMPKPIPMAANHSTSLEQLSAEKAPNSIDTSTTMDLHIPELLRVDLYVRVELPNTEH